MRSPWIVALWFVAGSAVTGLLVVTAVNGESPSVPVLAAIVAVPVVVTVAATRLRPGDGHRPRPTPRPAAASPASPADAPRPAAPPAERPQRSTPTQPPARPRRQAPTAPVIEQAPSRTEAATVDWFGGGVPAPARQGRDDETPADGSEA